jgi:hypothetical protein
MRRNDFVKWIEGVLHDKKLTSVIRLYKTREKILQVVKNRRDELWKRLR